MFSLPLTVSNPLLYFEGKRRECLHHQKCILWNLKSFKTCCFAQWNSRHGVLVSKFLHWFAVNIIGVSGWCCGNVSCWNFWHEIYCWISHELSSDILELRFQKKVKLQSYPQWYKKKQVTTVYSMWLAMETCWWNLPLNFLKLLYRHCVWLAPPGF